MGLEPTAVEAPVEVELAAGRGRASVFGRAVGSGLVRHPTVLPFVLLIVCTVAFQLGNSAFLTSVNISGMLAFAPELGLTALGMTLLLTAGQFDLSVGSMFGAIPLLVFTLVNNDKMPLLLAVVLGLCLAALIGLINGLLVTRGHISSFLVTLAMQLIVAGGALYLSNGFPQGALNSKSFLITLFAGSFNIGSQFTIYAGLFWFVGAALLFAYMLNRTRLGNWITAIGGNREAARARGIPAERVTVSLFVVSAVMAGLAGVISSMRLDLSYPTAGQGYELQAIAIAVIGGTSLFGGAGTIAGTVIGSLLIREMNNGVILVGVPGLAYDMFVGLIILVAMLLQSGLRKVHVGR